MQTVLGLSMTSTSVGWVLLDGNGSEAAALDHDAFDVTAGTASTAGETAQHTAAVRGAQSIATASGHKVSSVRVTWTEDIDADAKTFVKSLADLGFDDVLAMPLSTAGQAWGLEAGRESEHTKSGICILEPDAATVMIVATGAGSVRTAVTENRHSADDLIEWLRTVFREDGWLPESLYLVGSRRDLDEVAQPIADALPIPVHDTVDAQLALARGAALASATQVGAAASPVVATKRDRARQAPPTTPPVDSLATTVAQIPVRAIEEPAKRAKQRERPWLVVHAKKVAISAAGVAVVGAALSLAAGSALNRETVAVQAAQAADPASQDASVTSASIHPVYAPVAAPPVPAAVPLAAAPEPLAAPPAPPETLAPEPVARAAEPLIAAVPQPAAVPQSAAVPQTPAVQVPQHPAAPSQRVPTVAPPAAPLAAPAVQTPPAAAPLAAPAPAAGVPVAPVPAAAPPAPVPAEPEDPPPPPDPIQTLLSPLFGGLP